VIASGESRDVLFVLLPGVVLLDVAGPAEAFRIANHKVPGSYRLRFAAARRSLSSAVGLTLGELETLPAHVAPGTIVVVTGVAGAHFTFASPDARRLVAWLRKIVSERVLLLTVCAGSVIAAKAGLLAGRECTTHHAHVDELRTVEPRARVLDNRIFVEDGHILSSAGVTAGLDLALHVIGRQHGAPVAADVARELVVYLRRSGADPALSPWVLHRNHLHPAVHRVQDAVTRAPAARWKSDTLAAVACTSARHLARLFAEHAGCSPLDYVQLIRVALARELVTQTDLDLEHVAEKSGFSSAHQLRRIWRRWDPHPPSVSRARH
jgi:transcriptional regulator GlxA family with amidase domain